MDFNCECLELLVTEHFVDTGTLITPETGVTRPVVILRRLKEGKDGRLTVGTDYLPIIHCPHCGTKVAVA